MKYLLKQPKVNGMQNHALVLNMRQELRPVVAMKRMINITAAAIDGT